MYYFSLSFKFAQLKFTHPKVEIIAQFAHQISTNYPVSLKVYD